MDSIWNILERVVAKNANKVAIADQHSRYTYNELFNKVKSLNGLLTKYGRNRPVVVFADRSIDTIIYILAVVGSGNYYIPLDASLPKEKLQTIFEDSKPVAIFGREENKQLVDELDFDGDFYTVADNEYNEHFTPVLDDEPLYMVYTSGSTGKPKGVLKSNKGMVSFVKAFSKTFPFEQDTIVGNQTPFFFDASAKDLYLSLCNAATLEIIPSEKFVLPVMLINYLNERKINWICWVPSALCLVTQLNTFLAVKPQFLRRVFFVGEVFPIKQLQKWVESLPDVKFVNLYGSSEIAGVCCYYEVGESLDALDVLPMGKALPNCEITLRDQSKTIKESGIVGEVFISSDALALEYFHDKEKTDGVFFLENNKRTFQSGDLARYDKNMDLCFVSRKDFQIKHMGRRIELGEIEAACDKILEVDKCCCLYDDIKKNIVLFCELNKPLASQQIRNMLREKLAEYMIPNKVIMCEKIPLNANGKINRQALKKMF